MKLNKVLVVFGALLLTATTCVADKLSPPKPNIVFILSDDQSYPFLHCLGMTEMKTPNLDRFAGEGMIFHKMFTTAPQCVPSRASIMSGRSPVACRITRFSSPLPREIVTFPELLKKEAGYFVGVLGRTYHLDGSGNGPDVSERVFEEHKLKTFKERFDYVDSSNQAAVPSRMKEFFDQRPKNQPYFLWVNFNDPHHPWDTGKNPPKPETVHVPGFLPDLPGVREDLAAYEGEIEHADGDFQNVLDIIKDRAGLENTLIFFMGDNGMAFPSGKGCLHDPGLHVPLLAWWPGVIKPGGESKALLTGEDIAPTCLDAAGLKVPEYISGASFLPAIQQKPYEGHSYIFGERGPHGAATFDEHTTSNGVDYSRCARSAKFKLIYNVTPNIIYAPVDSMGNPSWVQMVQAHKDNRLASEFETLYFKSPRPVYELYDLDADPNELHNLAADPAFAKPLVELKEALQEKMIVDFDYLPLPIPGGKKARPNKPAKPPVDRNAMFDKLDTNHDGKLSFEEFAAHRDPKEAAAWFKARDKNSDGFLSREEFVDPNVSKPKELRDVEHQK